MKLLLVRAVVLYSVLSFQIAEGRQADGAPQAAAEVLEKQRLARGAIDWSPFGKGPGNTNFAGSVPIGDGKWSVSGGASVPGLGSNDARLGVGVGYKDKDGPVSAHAGVSVPVTGNGGAQFGVGVQIKFRG